MRNEMHKGTAMKTFKHCKSGKIYVQVCEHDVRSDGTPLVRLFKDGKPFGPVKAIPLCKLFPQS